MKLIGMTTITDGYEIVLDNPDGLSLHKHIFLRNSNEWDMNNMYKVSLQINGTNTDEGLTIITQGGDVQDALDKAVDFAIENDLNFQYCDFYEARDNDMINNKGNVIDSTCCGNTGVYIPCMGWHVEEIQSIF